MRQHPVLLVRAVPLLRYYVATLALIYGTLAVTITTVLYCTVRCFVFQSAMPFLLVYAVGLNVIPLLRGLANKRENERIRQRNGFRRQWAERLKGGGAVVKRKLKATKAMATSLK